MDLSRVAGAEGPWDRHGAVVDPVGALALHLRARHSLRVALGALQAAGIPVLPVKGAILAHLLYKSPAERPLRDLDLRVRPQDRARATSVLAGLPGATAPRASRVYGSAVITLGGVDIDLETRVGPPFLCSLTVASLLRRARSSREALGFDHLRIDLHDHALLLVVNVFKDHIVDAAPWAHRDLSLLVARPDLDPLLLLERAREAQCTTLLHVVASHYAALGPPHGPAWEVWARLAREVIPARPRYARHLVSLLDEGSEAGTIDDLRRRVTLRGASDSTLRAGLAVGAMGLWKTFHVAAEAGARTRLSRSLERAGAARPATWAKSWATTPP